MKMKTVKDFLYWEVWNRIKGDNVKVVCAYIMHNDQLLTQTAQRNQIVNTNDSQKIDISQMRVMEPMKQKSLEFVPLDSEIKWTPANATAAKRFMSILKNYRQYIRG